jgi:predicted RNase H-like HicB family nuclease
MITYRAMYKYLDDGVHAEVLDFPGVISCGGDLAEARRLLRGALADVAETALQHGEPLPQPNPAVTNSESDLEEPIHLLLQAATHVVEVPLDASA